MNDTLLGLVTKLVVENPNLTTLEIFTAIRPKFSKDNAKWLRYTINSYKHRIRRQIHPDPNKHT